MTAVRILPQLDETNRDFWTGGEKGELRIAQCRDCKNFVHPPRPVCNRCLSDNVGPAVVSGRGRVATYTINHQAWMPGMEVPFVYARVELDDAPGVFISTNIVGCPVEEVHMGDAVRVRFLQQDDVWLPLFEKVAS